MIKRLQEIQKNISDANASKSDRPFANIAKDFAAHRAAKGSPVTSPVAKPKAISLDKGSGDATAKDEKSADDVTFTSPSGPSPRSLGLKSPSRSTGNQGHRSPWASPSANRDGCKF